MGSLGSKETFISDISWAVLISDSEINDSNSFFISKSISSSIIFFASIISLSKFFHSLNSTFISESSLCFFAFSAYSFWSLTRSPADSSTSNSLSVFSIPSSLTFNESSIINLNSLTQNSIK